VSPDDKILYLIEAKRRRRRRAHDSQVRPAARWNRAQHEGSLQLLSRPQRRRHEHRYEGNLYASAGMGQLRGTSETLATKTGIYVISPEGKLLKFIPIPEITLRIMRSAVRI